LDYDEKKMGFAADRRAWAMNAGQKSKMIENLQRAAKELLKKTRLGNEEIKRRSSPFVVNGLVEAGAE
jgi:hypothetical protein